MEMVMTIYGYQFLPFFYFLCCQLIVRQNKSIHGLILMEMVKYEISINPHIITFIQLTHMYLKHDLGLINAI